MTYAPFIVAGVAAVVVGLVLYVVTRALAAANRLEGADGEVRRGLRMGATIGVFGLVLLPWLLRLSHVRDPFFTMGWTFGFLVALGVLFSAVFLVLVDAAHWLARALRRTTTRRTAPPLASTDAPPTDAPPIDTPALVARPADDAAETMPRRSFLQRAGYGTALAVGTGHAGYAMIFGRHDYALEEVTVAIRDLPPAFEGLSIAQISDVHVGAFVREPELAAALDLLRRARADLIVMTGDMVDFDPAMVPHLGRLTRGAVALGPRFGVHGIPGNHDYYTGVDDVLGAMRASGVRILRNEATEIRDGSARLALLGTDDIWADHGPGSTQPTRYDLDATLAAAPRDCPRILLCHNPERFREAAPHVDLQLSGHTHGGQVNLGLRPADLVLRHGFVAGHYRVGEGQLYVNRGFGTAGPPARLYAPPEITKITLVRG